MTDRKRTHLINSFERAIPHAENGMISVSVEATKEIIALLKEEPEIIRCKDCRHWDAYNVECMKRHHPVPPYGCWYCADGERKESL